jgi:hypothetical protein
MDFRVQRVDSAPTQPVAKRKQPKDPDQREFEQELEEAQPEPPVAPAPNEDTPVAPRLKGEAGGNLDLTA